MKRLTAILAVILLLFTCACGQIPDSSTATASSTPSATVAVFTSAPDGPSGDTQSNTLYAYFIDVGQADSALLVYNDYTVLIDAGNVADGPDVVSFIKKLGISSLDVVIATHAHEDHAGGLANVLSNLPAEKIYSPVSGYSSACFREFKEEAEKQNGIILARQGLSWKEGDVKFNVLWPIAPENEDTNNTSIVLKVTYKSVSYLFTGDIEHDAESRLVETGADLSANILKSGHHGSDTSSSYLFMRSVLPQIAVISVGEGNSYGHPNQSVLDKYAQAEIKTYRTDHSGTVTVSTDGTAITVTTAGSSEELSGATATPGFSQIQYIGNKNSKNFHDESCSSLPKEENRIYFASRQSAVDSGYSPCGICNP